MKEEITDVKKDYKKILESEYISRDMSWLMFNYRVLEQAKSSRRTIFERLKFLAICASNLDEFMMIRVGSLYNYLDYNKKRIDYSGLREWPFKYVLYQQIQAFTREMVNYFETELRPKFKRNGFTIQQVKNLTSSERRKVNYFFSITLYPMLTPMVFDAFHSFPVLMNETLIYGVTTKEKGDKKENSKLSFIQIPQNLPRFFEIEREGQLVLVPIEDVIRYNIEKFYKNIEIESVSLFRIIRNGDFDYDDYDESEVDFVEEIQKKLKKRKTGRVVWMEVQKGYSQELLAELMERFEIEEDNVFCYDGLMDYNSLWQIVKHKQFSDVIPKTPPPVKPLFAEKNLSKNIFEVLKKKDIVLHHPYNSIEPVVRMLELAAEDPEVLAIKITIYRLADDSRVANALQQAAENGKHVSVLFEVKARFDEENNILNGQRLEKAGCFVIYGVSMVKTHTKLLMIVRKNKKSVMRYVHMSSGNYNEDTARLYTDTSFLTTRRVYGNDVSEFFNVITGHSQPSNYKKLITTPGDMRAKLIRMIRKEASNARKGLTAGICIKVNSLEDSQAIQELYKASQAGVPVKLIVRGICCLRPGRKGLSENITVKSIVGDLLEHSRVYYFHNEGQPKVYGGSADVMVRSFDRRIESLFLVEDKPKEIFINILDYSLRDDVNSFILKEDGDYEKATVDEKAPFNVHKEFFRVKDEDISGKLLF